MEKKAAAGGEVVLWVLGAGVAGFSLWAIAQGFNGYDEMVSPDPTPMNFGQHCCVRCTVGKACGDTCIEQGDMCHVSHGCACDG